MSVYNNPSSAPVHPDGVSPIIAPVSPQSTGLAASNPSIISPQITGVTTNAAPAYTPTAPALQHPEVHQQQPQTETHAYPESKPEAQAYQGIEVVAPNYNMNPNANPNGNPDQNQNPNGYYDESKNTHPPPQQGQYPQGAVPPQQQGRNQYASAMPLRSLQSGPTPVDCPVCGVREVTAVEYVSGSTTHLSALLCCIVTCLGCIPYMVSAFKDVEQKCGHCGTLLAVWHRSGRTEVMVAGAH
ncbi:LPS-induced tumor necrosis factor alpha factor protein [Rutstroemia sp. NJR-2017a BBW]|nr:LPS-induced tumor necrosis factor alpha factor protein [Rutstroemia sp. NJR-2017a BBW]